VIVRAVITFHSIDDRAGPLSYAPADFAVLLATLASAGLPVVDLDTLLAPGTVRGVALTFDDGMRSMLDSALPILREHRAPAHLFLATGAIDGTASYASGYPMLTWAMVARLAAHGVAIEGHTHGHPDLRTLSDTEIDAECAGADLLIERHVGRSPRYFAYPFGACDRRVSARAGARYAGAFTTRLGFLRPRDARSELPRFDAHYLRGPVARRPLTAPSVRGYLLARKLLRRLRGSE